MKFILIFVCLFLEFLASSAQVNDSLTINYNYINSIPQNAEVFINDSLIGFTPCRFLLKKTDTSVSYDVIIKFKGYLDYSYSFNASQMPVNETFFLQPVDNNTKSPNQVLENQNSYFKSQRKIIPISISVVLAAGSGITAYYFKQLADDRYDEYLNSGDQALLDKTRKYDVVSGISIVLFQLGLAGLIYFLLIE